MLIKINNRFGNKNSGTFGGEIYRRDYDAHHTMSDVAARIAADQGFEKRCIENARLREFRNNMEKHTGIIKE